MKLTVIGIVLIGWSSSVFAGNVSSIGNGATGAVQQVTMITNSAESFNASANEWIRKWPTEKVRRTGTDASAATIEYCLSGSKLGADLIKSGDAVAHQYDDFMAANPTSSDNVKQPAAAEDQILHSIFSQWKANGKAAACN
jgi:hypothetical protein